jgi:hypothetical protein
MPERKIIRLVQGSRQRLTVTWNDRGTMSRRMGCLGSSVMAPGVIIDDENIHKVSSAAHQKCGMLSYLP